MNFTEYQSNALNTWNPPERAREIDISYLTLGLVNEGGEVAGKIKKLLRGDYSDTPEFRQELLKELGDVLWYLSGIASEFDLDLEDIARENIEKLTSRKQRGVIKGNGDNR